MVEKGYGNISALQAMTAKDFKFWYVEAVKLHNYMNKVD